VPGWNRRLVKRVIAIQNLKFADRQLSVSTPVAKDQFSRGVRRSAKSRFRRSEKVRKRAFTKGLPFIHTILGEFTDRTPGGTWQQTASLQFRLPATLPQ